ncbi:MAG: hypothetical protein Q8K60_08475, partial [Parachlamydiaceae bacterium]|nr:hypothetical protein [Parachlamydiaceae bacterium]
KPSNPFKITVQYSDVKEKIKGEKNDFSKEVFNSIIGRLKDLSNLNIKISLESFEFIRRIPRHEWIPFAKIINESRDINSDELAAFTMGKWDHSIYKEEEWPALALRAFFKNEMTLNQVSMLLIYDFFLQASNNGQGQILYYQLNHLEEIVTQGTTSEEEELDEEDFDQKQDLLLNLITGIAYSIDIVSEMLQSHCISLEEVRNEIKKLTDSESHLIAFFRTDTIHNHWEYLLSPALLEAFLKGIFKENAIRPNFVLGMSLRDDFMNWNKRDLFIPCRYLSLPEEIHGIDLRKFPYNIYKHDVGHCFIESLNLDRKMWTELAANCEKVNSSLLNTLNLILDRDLYYRDLKNQRCSAFRRFITVLISNNDSEFQHFYPILTNFMLNTDFRFEYIRAIFFGPIFSIRWGNFDFIILKDLLEKITNEELIRIKDQLKTLPNYKVSIYSKVDNLYKIKELASSEKKEWLEKFLSEDLGF